MSIVLLEGRIEDHCQQIQLAATNKVPAEQILSVGTVSVGGMWVVKPW